MDELREKYLQDKLSEAERKAFEEQLSDADKEELAFELGVREGLESGFRSELRKQVEGFEKKGRTARRINPAYISIAASIFLVSSLVLYFTRDETPLFDQYYEVYPNYEVTTVRGEEDLSSREHAYAAYDAGDFNTAIDVFSELDSLMGADYFFRGICYIQVTEYEKALSDFDKVISIEDKDYETASIWYTALIQIKIGNINKGRESLLLLHESEEFASTANKLLDDIEHLDQ